MFGQALFVCIGILHWHNVASVTAPKIKLNNGKEMPSLGLGTALGNNSQGRIQPGEDEVENAVVWALDAGYRHIDTALVYGTEPQKGRALERKFQAGLKREEVFLTTEANQSYDYTDYLETWRGMIEAKQLGLVTSIGVSNFNASQIDRIIASGLETPAVLQVEGRIQPGEDEVENAVVWALDAGYRHIDTALVYGTEPQKGRALKRKFQAGLKREEVFLTTELWNEFHARDGVVPALRRSLDNLGVDRVNLYLIHWPLGQFANQSYDYTDYLETWRGMIEAKQLGLVTSIGVSNFNASQIDRIIASGLETPAVLQVEANQSYDYTDYLETWRGMIEAKQLGLVTSIGVSNFNASQIDRIIASGLETPAVLQVEGRIQPGEDEVENAVVWPLDAGYRHIDTALVYGTEPQKGRALERKFQAGLKREEVFLTTKLWNEFHARDGVVPALRRSLDNLGVDRVDL